MSPRFGVQLLAHEDEVAVEDAVLDHRLALHAQREHLAVWPTKKRSTFTVSSMFSTASSGCAGGDAPEERHVDHVLVAARRAHRTARADRPQRARLQVLALQVALLLERAQVIVHAVRRTDAEVQADLAQGRRVAAIADGLRDEVEDLALAIREGAPRVIANQRQRAHVLPPPVIH